MNEQPYGMAGMYVIRKKRHCQQLGGCSEPDMVFEVDGVCADMGGQCVCTTVEQVQHGDHVKPGVHTGSQLWLGLNQGGRCEGVECRS